MDKGNVPDLKFAGLGGAAGGLYNNVILDGVGRINGPVTARTFKGNGLIKLGGSLAVEEMEVSGNLKIQGGLQADTIKNDGMLTVEGGLQGGSCCLNGVINVKGDCELEDFTGDGVITIDGLLSAGRVNLKLQGQAKMKGIHVESLVVRQGSPWGLNKLAGSLIPKLRPELNVRYIEGDFIDVENTTAEVIRGNIVIIGQGSSIGRVEYRTGLTVHPGAVVGQEVKIGE
ncbi:hypothetical protein [Paenibacillus sp. BAC0078]